MYHGSPSDDMLDGHGEVDEVVFGTGMEVERLRRTCGSNQRSRREHPNDHLGCTPLANHQKVGIALTEGFFSSCRVQLRKICTEERGVEELGLFVSPDQSP